jgi:hypothetical protein
VPEWSVFGPFEKISAKTTILLHFTTNDGVIRYRIRVRVYGPHYLYGPHGSAVRFVVRSGPQFQYIRSLRPIISNMNSSSADYRPRLENPNAFRGDAKVFYVPPGYYDRKPGMFGRYMRDTGRPKLEYIVKYHRF